MWRFCIATFCILPIAALGQQVSFDRDIRPIMSDTWLSGVANQGEVVRDLLT